ncbi:MAG TPA: type II secretion system protein [Planctomycetota bacterium]|nr:type II secretion system protein [Planctomycetota bacterium]
MNPSSQGHRRAFVLVEILAVTAVLAILMGLGYSVYRGSRLAARVALAQNNLKQIGTALDLYFHKYGCYPPYGSYLSDVLLPFVGDTEVFGNPLMPEEFPGQTVNSLYFPPTLDEADGGKYYITAFVSDDGQTAVVLNTGLSIEKPDGLSFNPTNAGDIIHAITGETVISGIVNVDPRNNPDSELTLCLPGGRIITRTTLHSSRGELGFNGAVEWVRFGPKGTGQQNGIEVNGAFMPLYNSTSYTISALAKGRMRIRVWNEVPVMERTKRKVNSSVDMGEWYFDVLTIGGQIGSNK